MCHLACNNVLYEDFYQDFIQTETLRRAKALYLHIATCISVVLVIHSQCFNL
jgi:hypothetical protein